MLQDRCTARLVKPRLKDNLAVVGRHATVADMGLMRVWGSTVWLIWLFVHIAHLIEFDNKVMVLFQWAWNYFTRKRGARLNDRARCLVYFFSIKKLYKPGCNTRLSVGRLFRSPAG